MAIQPSSTPSDAHISYTFSTVGLAMNYRVPIQHFIWAMTTAATSTWALHLSVATAVSGTTDYTYFGPLTAGSTGAGSLVPSMIIPWNNWCDGITITAMTGGTLTAVRVPKLGEGYSW